MWLIDFFLWIMITLVGIGTLILLGFAIGYSVNQKRRDKNER